jgi:hypothetical protein
MPNNSQQSLRPQRPAGAHMPDKPETLAEKLIPRSPPIMKPDMPPMAGIHLKLMTEIFKFRLLEENLEDGADTIDAKHINIKEVKNHTNANIIKLVKKDINHVNIDTIAKYIY